MGRKAARAIVAMGIALMTINGTMPGRDFPKPAQVVARHDAGKNWRCMA
jgi:hypothetical protein